MLNESNAIYLMEDLLLRHVYGRPLELKRDVSIRQSAHHSL